MKWYRRLLAEAGLGTSNLSYFTVLPLLGSCLVALAVSALLGVTALAFAAFAFSIAAWFEVLRLRALKRTAIVIRLWPEVVESLVSALQAGLSLSRAIDDLAKVGPVQLRKSFSAASEMLSSGHSVSNVLDWLKLEFSTEPSDLTLELIRLVDHLGGHSAIDSLASLAENLRKQVEFEQQLEAKQGWVVTSAKLGLLAPWLVVFLLSRRPETSAVYNSLAGNLALIGGLGLCFLSYFLIQLLARPIRARRVFANVAR